MVVQYRDADATYYMGGVNNGHELVMGDFKCEACVNKMVLADFPYRFFAKKINWMKWTRVEMTPRF